MYDFKFQLISGYNPGSPVSQIWAYILILPLFAFKALEDLIKLSQPQFPNLYNGESNATYLVGCKDVVRTH